MTKLGQVVPSRAHYPMPFFVRSEFVFRDLTTKLSLQILYPLSYHIIKLSTMTPSLPSTAAHSGWTNQSNFKHKNPPFFPFFPPISFLLFLSSFTHLCPSIKYVTFHIVKIETKCKE